VSAFIPDSVSGIIPDWVSALSRITQEFNRESAFRLFYGGDFALSRRYFARLLRTEWRAWAYLLITSLPAGWISAARLAARRMRRAR